MLHPVFNLLINRPELVAEHLAGYVSLAEEEIEKAKLNLLRQLLAWVCLALSLTACVVLSGVAAMLYVMYGQLHWIFLFVPGLLALTTLAALQFARRYSGSSAFSGISAQIDADVQTLKAAGGKP